MDTKGDGSTDCNRFSGTTNLDRSYNGCNIGKIWTIRRWLARSAMVLVAVEKSGGLFLTHGQDKQERNQRLLAWPCRKYCSKFWDIVNVEVDTVEAITEVDFHQLDGAQG